MYTSPFAVALNTLPASLMRLAIQGAAHVGKTWACTTFPRPVFLEFDNKMEAHKSRKDIEIIAFWNDDLCESMAKSYGVSFRIGSLGQDKLVVNRANIYMAFLKRELGQFANGQTVITDSFSSVSDAIDDWLNATPVSTKDDKENGYAFWRRKADINKHIFGLLKTAKCNVVVTFHETSEMNTAGMRTGKMNPLVEGKTKEDLGKHWGSWFRQTAESVLDGQGKPTMKTRYEWQIKPDSHCNCCVTIPHLIASGKLKIPATYNSLLPDTTYQEVIA